jgi:hypothetical protein
MKLYTYVCDIEITITEEDLDEVGGIPAAAIQQAIGHTGAVIDEEPTLIAELIR